MEHARRHRLKGYVKARIVGMRYHYKSSDGQRLPNPPPGCFVSLQLEPSNPYHHNAIKVINEADTDTHHLGYIVRKIADALTPLLKENTISARGILSNPVDPYDGPEAIPCQVLLFFAVPPELVPPLPPQLVFHENLSSPHFMLARTPVAFIGCSLADYDSYVARSMVSLHPQPSVEQNSDEPLPPVEVQSPHNLDGPPDTDATFDGSRGLDEGMESQSFVRFADKAEKGTEPSSPTEARTHEQAAEPMECKQKDGAPFVQCARSRCPMFIHGSCILGVVGCTCLFCLYLALLERLEEEKKGSDSNVALEAKCDEAMNSAIRFFGKDIFMRLRKLAGLDLPTQVQVPCSTNIQCFSVGGMDGEVSLDLPTQVQLPCSINKQYFSVEGMDGEAVVTSTIIERSAAKEKKENVNNAANSGREEKNLEEKAVAGRGKRRLPPRPRLDRACKKRIQAQPHW